MLNANDQTSFKIRKLLKMSKFKHFVIYNIDFIVNIGYAETKLNSGAGGP